MEQGQALQQHIHAAHAFAPIPIPMPHVHPHVRAPMPIPHAYAPMPMSHAYAPMPMPHALQKPAASPSSMLRPLADLQELQRLLAVDADHRSGPVQAGQSRCVRRRRRRDVPQDGSDEQIDQRPPRTTQRCQADMHMAYNTGV